MPDPTPRPALLELDGASLTLEQLRRFESERPVVRLAAQARERMERSVAAVAATVTSGRVAYGINTGFGAFANQVIPAAKTQKLQLNPGAERLVQACKAAGLKTLLVSGGFTFFTDRIRDRLGIDFTRSNVLEVESGPNCGQLTGRMVDQPWGDICDGAEKRKMLLETCSQLGISPKQAIAMGDGANDLPMMGEAGLSVAYHAKPKVREQAMVQINEGGLDRLLEIFA